MLIVGYISFCNTRIRLCHHHQCKIWASTLTLMHRWRPTFPEQCPALSPYCDRSAVFAVPSLSRCCNHWSCPWCWHASITAMWRWPALLAISSTDFNLRWMLQLLLHGLYVLHRSPTNHIAASWMTLTGYKCHSGSISSSPCWSSFASMVQLCHTLNVNCAMWQIWTLSSDSVLAQCLSRPLSLQLAFGMVCHLTSSYHHRCQSSKDD